MFMSRRQERRRKAAKQVSSVQLVSWLLFMFFFFQLTLSALQAQENEGKFSVAPNYIIP